MEYQEQFLHYIMGLHILSFTGGSTNDTQTSPNLDYDLTLSGSRTKRHYLSLISAIDNALAQS